jgi:hypothetical protein
MLSQTHRWRSNQCKAGQSLPLRLAAACCSGEVARSVHVHGALTWLKMSCSLLITGINESPNTSSCFGFVMLPRNAYVQPYCFPPRSLRTISSCLDGDLTGSILSRPDCRSKSKGARIGRDLSPALSTVAGVWV